MCVFCSALREDQILYESEYFNVVFDIDPIQNGHVLIISKAHYMNYLDLPMEVVVDLMVVERKLIGIFEQDLGCYATTVVRNNGRAMDDGLHFHVHIIPRYKGDGFWDGVDVVHHRFDNEAFLNLL